MSTSAPTASSPTPGGRCAPCPWPPPWSRRRSWPGTATGRSSSPASRSPPGVTSCTRTAPWAHRPGGGHPGRAVPESAGAAGQPGAPHHRPRTSAAGAAGPCPTCAPISTCPCRAACDAVLKRMNRKYDTARYYGERYVTAAAFFDRPRHHHGPDRGLPRRDRGRSCTATLEFVRKSAPSPPCTSSPTPAAPADRQADAWPARRRNAVKEARAARAGDRGRTAHGAALPAKPWVGSSLPVLFEEDDRRPVAPATPPTPSASTSPPAACTTRSAPSASPPCSATASWPRRRTYRFLQRQSRKRAKYKSPRPAACALRAAGLFFTKILSMCKYFYAKRLQSQKSHAIVQIDSTT